MNRRTRNRGTAAILTALLAWSGSGCGSGTVTFGGGGGDQKKRVTVAGNLDSVSPVTSRDIVVFAYTVTDGSDRCPCPGDPSNSTSGKAAVLPSGHSTFEITGIVPGAIGVVFLLDNAGNAADGQIDPGDPIAILDDVDCKLSDVSGGVKVSLDNVDLAFSPAPAAQCEQGVSNPPAAGRARVFAMRFEPIPTTGGSQPAGN